MPTSNSAAAPSSPMTTVLPVLGVTGNRTISSSLLQLRWQPGGTPKLPFSAPEPLTVVAISYPRSLRSKPRFSSALRIVSIRSASRCPPWSRRKLTMSSPGLASRSAVSRTRASAGTPQWTACARPGVPRPPRRYRQGAGRHPAPQATPRTTSTCSKSRCRPCPPGSPSRWHAAVELLVAWVGSSVYQAADERALHREASQHGGSNHSTRSKEFCS